jgi:uncharacterized protein (TIGR00369 family)
MKYKVVRKQENSAHCMVCGLENPSGLKASFYELENKEVVAVFKPHGQHQSYPGRTHGGIVAAILDETIGRAAMITKSDSWGVTVDLRIEYLKPLPLDEELKAVGRITRDRRRLFEGTGEIILKDGEVAARGYAKYMRVPGDRKIDHETLHWKVTPLANDPDTIDI